MNGPTLNSTVEVMHLLTEALLLLDRASLSLPAAHVEHAIQILRDMIAASEPAF